MYISLKDGMITTVDELPDLSGFKPLNGLHYCDKEETLPDGHLRLNWQKCNLFSDDEVQKISESASVLERLFIMVPLSRPLREKTS